MRDETKEELPEGFSNVPPPCYPVNDKIRNINISIGQQEIVHYCPITYKSFVARPMVLKNRNGQLYYYCLICDKVGKVRWPWHLFKDPKASGKWRKKGYDEQALLSAVRGNPGITLYDIGHKLNWPSGKARRIAKKLEATGRVQLVPGNRNNRKIFSVFEIKREPKKEPPALEKQMTEQLTRQQMIETLDPDSFWYGRPLSHFKKWRDRSPWYIVAFDDFDGEYIFLDMGSKEYIQKQLRKWRSKLESDGLQIKIVDEETWFKWCEVDKGVYLY
jgi:DNA-binding MarR family transcriptional regulator